MKTIVTILLSGSLLLAADKKPAKKPVNQPAPITIPAGAVETEDGSFRYTDAQGKKWLYRNTPFGVSRVEDKPKVETAPQEDTLTKATVNGDTVYFEKPSPFGVVKWQKKKSELDAQEQRIVDRQKNNQ